MQLMIRYNMFPFGSHGYQIELKQADGKHSLSCLQFYNFSLMIRDDNYLLLFRDLLNQFIVDMYAKIESDQKGFYIVA